jgi:hypothetical protein
MKCVILLKENGLLKVVRLFLAQYAVVNKTNRIVDWSGAILKSLPRNLKRGRNDADLSCARLYTNLNQILFLCLKEEMDTKNMPAFTLCYCGQVRIESLLAKTAESVFHAFRRIMA